MPKQATKPRTKWHDKPLVWTLMTRTADGKQLSTLSTHASKAAAVAAMESVRKPKTAVHRSGHVYIFESR